MKLYNENGDQVYLYEYSESSEAGISRLNHYYSLREISGNEIHTLFQDYEKEKNSRIDAYEQARVKSGLDGFMKVSVGRKDLRREACYARYLEMTKDIKPMEDYEAYLVRNLELKEFDGFTSL